MDIKRIFKIFGWKNYYLYKFLHYIHSKSLKSSGLFNPNIYPVLFNFEISSFCNSHCDFCCRDQVVSAGNKQIKNMDIITVRRVLDKLKEIIEFHKTDEKDLQIAFLGLGEALMNPNAFEIFDLTREYFPNAFLQLNTNGIILNDNIIHKIIKSPLDTIVLSLCFFNKDLHIKHIGVDKYDKILANTLKLMKSRKELKPFFQIHVFDLPESRKYFSEFTTFWVKHLNQLDSLCLYDYSDLTFINAKKINYPCSLLWSQLAVDTEGYFYPCCIGPMIERSDFLCAGTYKDSVESIMVNIENTRTNHINGIYDVCLQCGNIERDRKLNKKYFKSYEKHLLEIGSKI
jgi:hypothetical protein